jgi:hypothetical protein
MATSTTLDLQGFCYQEREGIMPALNLACTDSGGWILDRTSHTGNIVEFNIEIQLGGIVELYANFVANGVELTRAAHIQLTDLCNCRHYSERTENQHQIVSLRLKLNFLEDVTLHSLLMTGSETA